METPLRRRFLSALLSLACLASAVAEPFPSVQAPIWVYLETVPGSLTPEELAAKTPPIRELDEIARFVLGGMVYGWKFTYTPSDAKRRVEERFELVPVMEIAREDTRFSKDSITPDYPKLTCWARFTVDETAARRLDYWNSVQFKSANGQGRGERASETAGIRQAYIDAVRQAVREHARSLEKNKPKEIRGEVLLRDNPRLHADEGWFVADIKVLVNIREIVPYSVF